MVEIRIHFYNFKILNMKRYLSGIGKKETLKLKN